MRITINQIKTALGLENTYDIVNAILNEQQNLKQYTPMANAENVAEVGAGLMVNQTVQNEFVTALVDRIGKVVLRNVTLKNPLAKFKKGQMPQGRTIEEIFVDITKAHKYDPDVAEDEVFKREIPNVHTLFHELNKQEFYKQTIQEDSLSLAFTSWSNFEGFLGGIISAMYNSFEVDEYKYMKLLIDNYYSKGLFTVVPVVDPTDETSTKEFVKKTRATTRKMSLPMGSRDYNALAVLTKTDMSDMHLFIDADLEATLDVDVLAKAFNMDKSTFMGNITVIDNFGSDGIKAVAVDREWYQVYDKIFKMTTTYNGQGLYWNYMLHTWQIMSASRFSNAVAFVVDGQAKEVTNVIVDPAIASLKQGKTLQFNAYVRTTDGVDRPVTWAVEGHNGASITGTSIDSDGILSVGGSQTGELKVTATVSVDPDGTPDSNDEYNVVGEAIVAVQPVT